MEIEKSRNGFYTLTFINKNNMEEKDIYNEFQTVGEVRKVVQNFNRVFIRYKEKEEAERALAKFGKKYNLNMAINSNNHQEGGSNHNQNQNLNPGHSHSHNHNHNQNHHSHEKPSSTPPLVTTPESSASSQSMEKCDSSKVFHLILGNLPRNYTIKDINYLVEEAKPICINQLDETRVFQIRFCHIVLDSAESLKYLIDKLNGFMICGEKLIAAEVKHLLEWKEKFV